MRRHLKKMGCFAEMNYIEGKMRDIEYSTGKKLLTVKDAAEYIGIGEEDMGKILLNGDMQAMKVGNNQFVKSIDLARFLCGEIKGNCSEKPLDFGNQVIYPSPTFENLSEADYMEMVRRGKGEGSVYYNESRNVWQAAISLGKDVNGKRLRKIISGQSKEAVLETLVQFTRNQNAQLERENTELTDTRARDITVKQFLDTCLENIEGKPRSRTFGNYIGTAKHIEEGLGHLPMSEFNRENVQRFINRFSTIKYWRHSKSDYYGKSAIHKVYQMLNVLIAEGVEKELVKKIFKIAEPRSKKLVINRNKDLTDEEIVTILNAVEGNLMLKTQVMILIYTGMRPAEVCALKVENIDFEKHTITVEQTLSFDWKAIDIKNKRYGSSEPGKKKRKGKRIPIIKNLKNDENGETDYACRTLSVSEKVIDVIKEWLNYIENNKELLAMKTKNQMEGMLFSGVKGHLVLSEYYQQVYERVLAKHGIDSRIYNLYRFRHNLCTRLLRAKHDPKVVMRTIGDNTLALVMKVYNSIKTEDILKASDEYATVMDNVLEG